MRNPVMDMRNLVNNPPETVVVDIEGPMIWARFTRGADAVPAALNIRIIVETLKQAVADELQNRFESRQDFENTTEGANIFNFRNLYHTKRK